MAKVTRIAYTNLVHTAGAVIVPSSEVVALPRAALLRPLHSDVLRFKTGWVVGTGENDVIDFDRGGVKIAFIAAGYYATGALLAEAIRVALEAADPTPVWACTYSPSTHKFTISTAAHAFVLLFASGGAELGGNSARIDIGFAAADTASATSATGGNVAYQSRHSINIDLGSALAASCCFVRGHNLTSAGTAVIQAHASTLVGQPLVSPFAGPYDFDATVAGNADPRVVFFPSTQTKRYLRLVLSDVQNPAGYNELGVLFVGPYSQPSAGESIEWSKGFEHLSENSMAVGGALHQVRRSRRVVYSLTWRVSFLSADVDLLEALDLAMPMGAHFFIAFDATDNPTTDTFYGFLRAGLQEQLEGGRLLVLPVQFAEALP